MATSYNRKDLEMSTKKKVNKMDRRMDIIKYVLLVLLIGLEVWGIHSIESMTTEVEMVRLFTAVMLNLMIITIIIVECLYELYIFITFKIKYGFINFLFTLIYVPPIVFSVIAVNLYINDMFIDYII
jgi:nitrate reductase NapE component